MKKIFTLLSIIILFATASWAQTGKITGIVKDASEKKLHSATVSLLKANDSSIVKFAATCNRR